jgi:HlyD family secretion protein
MREMMREQNRRQGSIRAHLLAGIAASALLVVGAGGWAGTTEIAGAVVAPGVVVVDSNVKKVQHPTGGVVSELLVHNGDRVTAGQIIVRFDSTQAKANLAILTKHLDELMARQAREEAERDGADEIDLPEALTSRRGDPDVAKLISGQQKLFEIRRKSREGQEAQLQERMAQLNQETIGYNAQETANVSEIEWIGKELEGVMTLWQKNLVQFTRVVALKRDLARAQGEQGQLVASVAQTKNKIAEIELQILQIDQDLRAEVGKDLATIRSDTAETTEKRVAAEDVLARVDIRAPQDGTVNEMSVHTVGGVVSPGEAMMMIVPFGDALDVEARIAPRMIDQVHVGQTAVLRFSAFNQRTTPEIDGRVALVSADLVQDPKEAKQGEGYYVVRISIPEAQLRDLKLQLVPGMPVECFVRTDDRTVISYLVKPLRDQIEKAFRER